MEPPDPTGSNQSEATGAIAKRTESTSTELAPRTYVTDAWDEHDRRLQTRLSTFLLRAFGGLLTVTMLIYLLQGFKLWGFHLEETTLQWIGGATVGQIAGLLLLTYKAVFGRSHD
jgi:hypothetical protein